MNIKDKTILGLLGTIAVGSLVGAVYAYGQMKYYEGRIDKNKEVMPLVNALYKIAYGEEFKSKRDEAK